jgi:fucose 4-O-acetylase-like acetyltransferase
MRTPYFDNAKLILIFLVVMGHLIESLAIDSRFLHSVYIFIYYFHIPTFVLISGYFSKNLSAIPRKIKKFLIYYVAFEVIYIPQLHDSTGYFLLKPYWVMWFMLSLILWNIMLVFFTKLRHPVILAVIVGVLAGYIDNIGGMLSLSRTLVFLPFFIAGYYLREKDFLRLKTPVIKGLVVFAAAGIFLLIHRSVLEFFPGWLYGSYSYASLSSPQWYAGLYRLGIYFISALLCLCLLALIPSRKYKVTYMGANTLNTYLIHGVLVMLIADAWSWGRLSGSSKGILIIALAVVLTALLSSNFVQKAVNTAFRPLLLRFCRSPDHDTAKIKASA